MTTVQKLRRALGLEKSRTTRSRRPVRPSLEGLEKREVMTVAFTPALGTDTVFWRSNVDGHPANSVVTGPVTNSTALSNPTVYLIFSGSSWTTTNVVWDAQLVKYIFQSPYLSGLTQYGSSGTATFGGYTIDHRPTPGPNGRDAEIQYALDVLQPSWQKPGSIAPHQGGNNVGAIGYHFSPIYVVIDDIGFGGASNGGGSYYRNGYQYLTNAINISAPVSSDAFTEQFSQELVDRMTDGTGVGIAMNAPINVDGHNVNAQIADNEPAGGRYTSLINGLARVDAYWSVVDRKFIVPDGSEQTVTLQPVWNGMTFTHQFDLLAAENVPGNAAPTTEPMNAAKTALTLGNEVFFFSPGSIRNVNVDAIATTWTSSQVWHNSGPGTGWTDTLTSGYYADQLVSSGFDQFMRANGRVWLKLGSSWEAITGTNTHVSQIVTSGFGLYMLANNGGKNQVWEYTGNGTVWVPITGTATTVTSLASSGQGLFMLANNGGKNQVWQFSAFSTIWTPVTGAATTVSQLLSTGNSLYMVANNGGANQVWRYAGPGATWTAVTTPTTDVGQVVACGDVLFMLGNINTGFYQVWRYTGFGTMWSLLTNVNTMNVTNIATTGDMLVATVTNPPTPTQLWSYTGQAANWVRNV